MQGEQLKSNCRAKTSFMGTQTTQVHQTPHLEFCSWFNSVMVVLKNWIYEQGSLYFHFVLTLANDIANPHSILFWDPNDLGFLINLLTFDD